MSKKTFQSENESSDPEKNSSLRKGNEARPPKGTAQRKGGMPEDPLSCWELRAGAHVASSAAAHCQGYQSAGTRRALRVSLGSCQSKARGPVRWRPGQCPL